MPGHDAMVLVDATPCGGARGRHHRSKVSMTTMCPPQHGQGGRVTLPSSGEIEGMSAGEREENAAPFIARIRQHFGLEEG